MSDTQESRIKEIDQKSVDEALDDWELINSWDLGWIFGTTEEFSVDFVVFEQYEY